VLGAVVFVTSLTRSVTLQTLDLQCKNEPGEPNGVPITARAPVTPLPPAAWPVNDHLSLLTDSALLYGGFAVE